MAPIVVPSIAPASISTVSKYAVPSIHISLNSLASEPKSISLLVIGNIEPSIIDTWFVPLISKMCPAASLALNSIWPSAVTLISPAVPAASTVVILRIPLVAPAIVTVSLVDGVITIESSVITVEPIVKSVDASIVVPVIAAAAKVPPATVIVLALCVRVTSPPSKLITPPLPKCKSFQPWELEPKS